MKEIRFHGRGGQGAVVASRILSFAAFKEGKYAQSFPFFGGERRGAPVVAYARLNISPIELRCKIEKPDVVIVLDPHALRFSRPLEGVKPGGVIVVNHTKSPKTLFLEYEFPQQQIQTFTVDATRISMEVFGEQPIPITNTTMLGAFASATSEISLDTMIDVLSHFFSGKILQKNRKAVLLGAQRLLKAGFNG